QNYQWMMIASLPLMLLYNGEKGKSMKYLFYLYYPIHVYILYILGIYLINGF
ncbi:conjugal transfer protein TraX, partial [Clostridioides difficile]